MSYNIRRMNAVQAKTGYSRSTIYLYISKGLWVKSIRISQAEFLLKEQLPSALVA